MTEVTAGGTSLAAMDIFAGCPETTLTALASRLEPLSVGPGRTLMEQGERAVTFLLIASGTAEATHRDSDGSVICSEVGAGTVVGEIALLRNGRRTATVTATTELTGWVGDDRAFAELVQIPEVMDRMVRMVRQRLAAYITPVPIRLRDGTDLLLRPVMPGDGERSDQAQFSGETIYRRFMSARTPSPALMHYLFEVDYVDHFVWVVTDPDGSFVADGRFVRDRDEPELAEIAFIVDDNYHGRGIGTLLLGALAVVAPLTGVKKFTARVLAENGPMRVLLDHHGAYWEREDPGIVTTVIEVPAAAGLPFDGAVADQIKDVGRQAIRAVG